MPDASGQPEDFLERIVDFPDGSRFERTRPLTDLRKDPGEGRILYVCKRCDTSDASDASEEFVMKIKAQWPGPQNLIYAGPSPLTTAELKALQLFRDRGLSGVPHLMTWKKGIQPHDGIHPGGYVVYTVMTKMPGETLWHLGYWSLTDEEREEIKSGFMRKLKEVRKLGVAPYDCALRNIMWHRSNKEASIVDFEHYHETTDPIEDNKAEFQRWGVVQRPPPSTWYQEWGLHK